MKRDEVVPLVAEIFDEIRDIFTDAPFYHLGGDEVKAGDSWVFPQGWKGTAEVIEKVRKVYLMMLREG